MNGRVHGWCHLILTSIWSPASLGRELVLRLRFSSTTAWHVTSCGRDKYIGVYIDEVSLSTNVATIVRKANNSIAFFWTNLTNYRNRLGYDVTRHMSNQSLNTQIRQRINQGKYLSSGGSSAYWTQFVKRYFSTTSNIRQIIGDFGWKL